MTADETALTTEAELNTALVALLERASENGVDVRGAWECPTGQAKPNWDVVVTELAAAEDAD